MTFLLNLPGEPDGAARPGISRSYAEGQDMEYKVFSGSFKPESLEREINRLAAEGWRVVSAFQAISWWRWECPWTIVLERVRA
jgi:hypothetical protein